MKTQRISHVIEVYRRLQPIAKSIHKLDENACSYELSKAQETRLSNLLKRAEELARLMGLHIYHQSDPRGCSLHLVNRRKGAELTYSTLGIAVY